MKRTLLTGAALIAMMGSTHAMADGFIVDRVGEPAKEAKEAKETKSVWVQQVNDGTHSYELRMEDGVYIAKFDGKRVPDNRIKNKGDVIVLLDASGGVLYEFKTESDHVHGAHGVHGVNTTVFAPSIPSPPTPPQWTGDGAYQISVVHNIESPKVMLGIYSGEPGDSLREHLGIEGDAILVERVIKGLAADKAGIKDNDIIISINGSDGISPDGLTDLLGDREPGDELKIVLLRKGQQMKLNAKLLAYDAKALGHTGPLDLDVTWVGDVPSPESGQKFRFFSKDMQGDLHEEIMEAMREEGLSEQQINEIGEKIRSSLNKGLWKFYDQDSQGNDVIQLQGQADAADRQFFAESMQRKAEQAMRDAERMTMEFKDGQLLLKRHAEGLENKLAQLRDQIDGKMPEIESELQGRLEELEERLDQLEAMLDERMESLSDLMERLIDRLEED